VVACEWFLCLSSSSAGNLPEIMWLELYASHVCYVHSHFHAWNSCIVTIEQNTTYRSLFEQCCTLSTLPVSYDLTLTQQFCMVWPVLLQLWTRLVMWYTVYCACVLGLFFQWVTCIAIWTSGFVLNGIRLFPQFHPLAALGGFLWCTGNIGQVYASVCPARGVKN